MGDTKPFTCEREANDAPASRQARALVDAMFRAGTFKPGDQVGPYAAIILDALKAAGVEISEWEERVPHWLGCWEVYQCQVIARFIEAAYEAGRASAPEAADTEWAVRWGNRTIRVASEDEARALNTGHAMRRDVGPWKEADDG